MTITDPIADMLTRIRNALAVHKEEVVIPYSRIKLEIAKILEENNYVKEVRVMDNYFKEILIRLKYEKDGQPAIRSLKRISKPGCRIYVKKDNLPRVLNDKGIAIISTSQGIMTNREAKRRGIGGEVLCEIY